MEEFQANRDTANKKIKRTHGIKSWNRYLFEFLLLFLAVTLGFFVDNLREDYSDSQREKQFVQSLIQDIEADKERLTFIIQRREIRDTRIDSMLTLLNSDTPLQHTKDIYFFSANAIRMIPIQFFSNDGTMQQLLHAGGLRLIRKQGVADSLVRYDAALRLLLRLGDQEASVVDLYREVIPKVLNGLFMDKVSDANSNPIRINFNPPLADGFSQHLNEFNYRLVSIRAMNKGYRRECKKLVSQADNLIVTLKKAYKIE